MKRLIATALLSLLALGWGMGQARAGGCGCCYQVCATQYNAFSPFCGPVAIKKGLFCKKCCHVLECCPPPAPGCPVDCVPGCETGVPADGHPAGSAPASSAPAGGAVPAPAGGPGFQAPAPMPAGPNTSMMRLPYGAPQPVMYLPAYQPAYGYPQAPVMVPGVAAMTTQGMVPMNAVPWHGHPPAGR